MDKIQKYDIIFSGLTNGIHEFQFEIDEAFFKLFDTDQEFKLPNLEVNAKLEKHTTFMELWLYITGQVILICDISLEDYPYSIDSESKYLIKLGDKFDDSHEEIIVIPRESHSLNIAQLIYENITLTIPMKKLSPNLEEEDLALLDSYSPQENDSIEEESEEKEVDPRWDALRKLKNK